MSSNSIATFNEGYILNMSQDTVMKAILTALNNLGWKYKVLSATDVEARVGMSIWSFGEKMSINIPRKGVVNVRSDGNSSIYHNKNKSNVINFLTQLKQTTLAYAIAEAKINYQTSLQKLKNNPVNPNLRETTLELGRIYSNLTRDERGVTIFDEIALMNDINAACAGAMFISNPIESKMPRQTIEERLNSLKELKTKGLIDEAEYNSKRHKILDEV